MDKKRADVLLGIPSYGLWAGDFGMCLVALVADFLSKKVEEYDSQSIRVWKKEGSILPSIRHGLVREAQKQKCTHLLFLDTDQLFPPDLLRRLLRWKKEVVACNIATKAEKSYPTARQKGKGPKGEVLYTYPGDVGLKQVWRIGCGVMLLDLSIFGRMTPPWFSVKYKLGVDDYQGEDWGLCEKLEQNGIPIYIDQELSWEIGHQGKKDYRMDEVQLPEISEKGWEELKRIKDAKEAGAKVQETSDKVCAGREIAQKGRGIFEGSPGPLRVWNPAQNWVVAEKRKEGIRNAE